MRRLHYHLVDVFTDRAFGGNPLAVVTNGRGVDDATMQAVAKEFNLSETTFVLPPDDPRHDWRVRIFTPGSELPMAGHPTVGTAFVLAREHLIPRGGRESNIVFEEGVGPVPVRVEFEGGEPSFAEMSQPLPTFGPRLEDRAAVAGMLSLEGSDLEPDLPVEVVSCGVPFLYVPLRSLDAARRARPRVDLIERVAQEHGVPPQVFVFTRETEGAGSTVHSRMFAPAFGITEDPATGAASGPLGSYLVRYGLVAGESAEMVSEQGIEMGRPSYVRITIERRGEEFTAVRVGGQCHFMGEGFIEIP
jgi:trans-2,3-dihydro-3-hydroxyanthranilate isomerase